MLADNKVDVINTSWDNELPKIIHDPRYRIIPQQFRRMIYEEYVKS
jgi:hypothetical protein